MHLMHARLFTKRAAQKKGVLRASGGHEKAAVEAAALGINVTGRMNHSAQSSALDTAAVGPPAGISLGGQVIATTML